MVLVNEKVNPVASFEFEAEILVLHHPTTISINYQAMSMTIFLIKMNLLLKAVFFKFIVEA